MRMKKTLWKLVLIDFHKYFDLGLCNVIMRMIEVKRITLTEFNFLMNEIRVYGESEDIERYDPIFYIWKPGEKEPRIKFIEDQIKKNTTNKNQNNAH
jgi:hypothetical protein